MMLNKTVMVSDANAAHTDEHLATLASVFQVFGDVYRTEEMISLMRGTETSRRQAAE